MPPKGAVAGGSRAHTTSAPLTNGHVMRSLPADWSSNGKRRAAEEVSEEDEDGEIDGDGLVLSEDEEADGEVNGGGFDDEEAFPELDSGSDFDEYDERSANEEGGGLEDEDSGSESGYNTSDIERRYGSSPSTSIPPSPSTSTNRLPVDEKLSRMISWNTVKPDEAVGTDEKVSRAKEGSGKVVRSRLVDGGYKREYEDIEAGYGSESSTEDVSGSPCVRYSCTRTQVEAIKLIVAPES